MIMSQSTVTSPAARSAAEMLKVVEDVLLSLKVNSNSPAAVTVVMVAPTSEVAAMHTLVRAEINFFITLPFCSGQGTCVFIF